MNIWILISSVKIAPAVAGPSGAAPAPCSTCCFLYVGKCFCTRRGEEQRKLGPSQFCAQKTPIAIHTWGMDQKIDQEDLHSLGWRTSACLVMSFQKRVQHAWCSFSMSIYLSKLPQFAFKEDVLYCQPKPKTPFDASSPWYDSVPVGKNKLGSMVKDMSIEAGLPPRTI